MSTVHRFFLFRCGYIFLVFRDSHDGPFFFVYALHARYLGNQIEIRRERWYRVYK